MSLQGGKCQFWVEKNAVEMVGEVRGANKVDTGPIFRGPYAFWVELHLDSFLKYRWKCHLWVENVNFGWRTGGGNG